MLKIVGASTLVSDAFVGASSRHTNGDTGNTDPFLHDLQPDHQLNTSPKM